MHPFLRNLRALALYLAVWAAIALGLAALAWQIRDGSQNHASTVAGGSNNTAAAANAAASIANSFVVPSDETLVVTEVFLQRQALVLRGAMIGNALPPVLSANTLFLSRAPDGVAVQPAPRSSSNPDCTT